LNEMLTMLCLGRPVWMSETRTQIELIVVGHYCEGNKYLWLPLYIPVGSAHDRP